jgi:hypothetical protein
MGSSTHSKPTLPACQSLMINRLLMLQLLRVSIRARHHVIWMVK